MYFNLNFEMLFHFGTLTYILLIFWAQFGAKREHFSKLDKLGGEFQKTSVVVL